VVSGEVIFDLGGLTVTAATSGNAGTIQLGTVVVDPEQVVSVKSTNPENNLRILGTTAVGTVTVEAIQRPITANLFATGQIGTVTVEDTRNETISVG
jgi:hypothetical protein